MSYCLNYGNALEALVSELGRGADLLTWIKDDVEHNNSQCLGIRSKGGRCSLGVKRSRANPKQIRGILEKLQTMEAKRRPGECASLIADLGKLAFCGYHNKKIFDLANKIEKSKPVEVRQLQEKRHELERLNDASRDAQDRLANIERSRTAEQAKFEAIKSSCAEKEARLESIKIFIKQEQKELEAIEADCETQRDDLTAMEMDYSAMQEKQGELRKERESFKQQLVIVREELRQVQEALEAARTATERTGSQKVGNLPEGVETGLTQALRQQLQHLRAEVMEGLKDQLREALRDGVREQFRSAMERSSCEEEREERGMVEHSQPADGFNNIETNRTKLGCDAQRDAAANVTKPSEPPQHFKPSTSPAKLRTHTFSGKRIRSNDAAFVRHCHMGFCKFARNRPDMKTARERLKEKAMKEFKVKPNAMTLKSSTLPEPLTGVIYAYCRKPHTEFIKIGFTTKPLEPYLKGVARRCKLEANSFELLYANKGKILHPRRVEEMVHAELLASRYDYRVCKCKTNHIEYFKLDLDTVRASIDRWSAWMSKDNYSGRSEMVRVEKKSQRGKPARSEEVEKWFWTFNQSATACLDTILDEMDRLYPRGDTESEWEEIAPGTEHKDEDEDKDEEEGERPPETPRIIGAFPQDEDEFEGGAADDLPSISDTKSASSVYKNIPGAWPESPPSPPPEEEEEEGDQQQQQEEEEEEGEGEEEDEPEHNLPSSPPSRSRSSSIFSLSPDPDDTMTTIGSSFAAPLPSGGAAGGRRRRSGTREGKSGRPAPGPGSAAHATGLGGEPGGAQDYLTPLPARQNPSKQTLRTAAGP